MKDIWNWLTDGFMPHGYCLRWDGPLLFVFIAGNLGIAIAYFIIPAALRLFIGKRKDLPFPHIFKLFAAFILSCGFTHVAKVWTLYQPAYWIEAALDFWTAGVSLMTAALLVPLIPTALNLRSPKELDDANRQLEDLNQKLYAANAELVHAKELLEETVKVRTTELREAMQQAKEGEAQFKMLFNTMPQLGWKAQPDGYIDFYNSRWYEYTGATVDDMLGWGWEQVHDATVLPDILKQWTAAIAEQKPVELRFPLRRWDGKFRWFLTRVTPVFDSDNRLICWVGVNTDIQDERENALQLEERVAERTSQLQLALDASLTANKTKSQFVSMVSHEVRTPMSGVIGLAEILSRRESCDAETKMLAGEIFNASKRLLKLLNDVLDFSKYESGHMRLEYRLISIKSLITEVIELIRFQAETKGLAIGYKLETDLEDEVCADEVRLRQVLANLVSNAVKFTSVGSVFVSVESVKKSSTHSLVRFSVTDTGPGISGESQALLFQPFVQADSSITRRFGGTGLGLALVKSFVELMGGEVGVESELNKGSTFWCTVSFPVGIESPCNP